MSINDLFIKGNKLFAEKKYLAGLEIYKNIRFKYPLNTRLNYEINKKIKIHKKQIFQSFSNIEIEKFFELQKLGHGPKVISTLSNFLKKNKNDSLAISLLGKFWELEGDFEKAIHFQTMAVKNSPFELAFYLNLSKTLKQNNKLEEALKFLHLAKILSLTDNSIDYEIAKLNTTLKNFAEADSIYKKLIKDKNVNKEIIYSYCDHLIKSNKVDNVIQFLAQHSKTNSKDDYYQLSLGIAYLKKKEYDLAKICFLNAIKLNTKNSQSFSLLADYYSALGDINNAKINYEKSLNIDPYNNKALNNLAAMSFFEGNLKEAEEFYNLSLRNNNNDYESLYYLSQCQLAMCNYKTGWKNFGYRWLANDFKSKKLRTNIPKFYLNSDRKNLLVWSEQGIGDQILFIRFLNNIVPYANNIYMNIDSRLHQIIERMKLNIHFINNIDQIKNNNINSQIPIGDLGSLFIENNSNLFKNNKTYITSDLKLTNDLKKNFNNKKKYICGLSWISKNEDIGYNKSISLDLLKPILLLKNITFIDLQYNDTSDERKRFYENNNIKIEKIDYIDSFNDINSVTSLIDICDFIITVSNTTAHLAGSMGKKTYLLLPKGKGRLWYWSSENNKSIWYSSIEIFKQNVTGSWDNVINKLYKTLENDLIE